MNEKFHMNYSTDLDIRKLVLETKNNKYEQTYLRRRMISTSKKLSKACQREAVFRQ